MRILILSHENPYPPKGGFNNAIFQTARYLAIENEVDIVSWGANSNQEYINERLRIFHIEENSLNDLSLKSSFGQKNYSKVAEGGSLLGLSQLLCTISKGPSFKSYTKRFGKDYDIILKEGPNGNKIAKKLSLATDIPMVERLHWVGLPWTLENYREWYQHLNIQLNRTTLPIRLVRPALDASLISLQCKKTSTENIITVTPYDRERAETHFTNSNLTHIYSTQPKPEGLNLTRNHDIQTPDYFVFFSSGTFFTEITLIFLERLAQHYPKIYFYVVGLNIDPNRFRSENVKVLGYLDDTTFNNVLERAKGFIFPLIEGHGLQTKLITALAYGKPIIATSAITMPVPELVNNEVLLVRDTPRSFIESINDIVEDNELSNRLSKNSIQVYEKHFSNESHGKNFLGYLKKIV